MKIDSLPNEKLTDGNGNISEAFRTHFENFSSQAQKFLSDECYVFPTQPDPRSSNQSVKALDSQERLAGKYYHAPSNTMKVNLEKYTNGSSEPSYEFVPQLSYHEVDSTADRDAMPAAKSTGKIVVVPSDPTKFYIYVNGAWRTGALT